MSDAAAWILLVGRLFFVVFFLNSTIFHLTKGQMAIGFAKHVSFPMPFLAGWPSGVWLLTGSLAIVLGVWADVGALMLGLFVILAAAGFHRYWEIEDQEQRQAQKANFLRNATYLGACLIIFAFFASFGQDIPLTITDPLFDLR
jgi:putative oxidoreductase